MTRKKISRRESDQEWDEDSKISYNPAKVKHWIIGLMALIIIIIGSGIAYAVVLTFQVTPVLPVPPSPVAAKIDYACQSLVNETSLTPVNGSVLLDCSNRPAFTVANPQTFHKWTPVFTLPNATETLGIVGPGGPFVCSSSQTVILQSQTYALMSGTYDYCLNYQNLPIEGGSLPSFTISWS